MTCRIFLLLLVLAPCLVLAEDEYQSPDVGIKFPETLAGMALVKVTDYEKDTPGLGVGVSYRAEKQKADIYIYTGGLTNPVDGVDSPEIHEHFKEVVADIFEMEKRGSYQNVKMIIPMDKVDIGSQPFLHADFQFTQQNEPRISHIYLTILKNRFLKIRFTYFASDQEEGKKTLDALLKSLGAALRSQ